MEYGDNHLSPADQEKFDIYNDYFVSRYAQAISEAKAAFRRFLLECPTGKVMLTPNDEVEVEGRLHDILSDLVFDTRRSMSNELGVDIPQWEPQSQPLDSTAIIHDLMQKIAAPLTPEQLRRWRYPVTNPMTPGFGRGEQ